MPLERVLPGPGRRAHLTLLESADPIVATYLDEGQLWVHDGGVGVVLTTSPAPRVVELRAVAVDPAHQRRGEGLRMLDALLAHLRADGWARVVVGTGIADPGALGFYQRAGFHATHVERDVFTAERGYDPASMVEPNGLVHRDQVWFALDLVPAAPAGPGGDSG